MTYEFITTWTPDDETGWFATVDWRELGEVAEDGGPGFIRVEGNAETAEAADVIRAISAFRQRSNAFVVTNAVKVDKLEGLDEEASSIEDIRSVSVVDMLMENLDPKQREAVTKLFESA